MFEYRDKNGNLKETNKAEVIVVVVAQLCFYLVLCAIVKIFDVCSLFLVALGVFGVASFVYLIAEGNFGIQVWCIGVGSVLVLWLYYFVRPKYKKTWRYKRFERRWL